MIQYKQKISKDDKCFIKRVLNDLSDEYRDYYITKNNLRLFIKENLDMVFHDLCFGDRIVFNEFGILNVVGYADKSFRKYIKILSRDAVTTVALISTMRANISDDVYCKLKINNPLVEVLLSVGFEKFGSRGQEILLLCKGTK